MSLIIDDIHKITAAVKATFSHIRAKVQMKTNIVIIIIRNDMTKIAGIISLDFIVLIFKICPVDNIPGITTVTIHFFNKIISKILIRLKAIV